MIVAKQQRQSKSLNTSREHLTSDQSEKVEMKEEVGDSPNIHYLHLSNAAAKEYWQRVFGRAKSEKNWEDLLEIGKNRLIEEDYLLAIACLTESRHFNLQEPLTHLYLGKAHQSHADALKAEGNAESAILNYEKAQSCYWSALETAESRNDIHFLTEFKPEIDSSLKNLDKELTQKKESK